MVYLLEGIVMEKMGDTERGLPITGPSQSQKQESWSGSLMWVQGYRLLAILWCFPMNIIREPDTPTPIWGGSLPYCATTLALFLPCFCTLSTVFLAGSFSLQCGAHLVPLCYGLYGLCLEVWWGKLEYCYIAPLNIFLNFIKIFWHDFIWKAEWQGKWEEKSFIFSLPDACDSHESATPKSRAGNSRSPTQVVGIRGFGPSFTSFRTC